MAASRNLNPLLDEASMRDRPQPARPEADPYAMRDEPDDDATEVTPEMLEAGREFLRNGGYRLEEDAMLKGLFLAMDDASPDEGDEGEGDKGVAIAIPMASRFGGPTKA